MGELTAKQYAENMKKKTENIRLVKTAIKKVWDNSGFEVKKSVIASELNRLDLKTSLGEAWTVSRVSGFICYHRLSSPNQIEKDKVVEQENRIKSIGRLQRVIKKAACLDLIDRANCTIFNLKLANRC